MKTTTDFQLVEVEKLIPYVNNARTHSKEQIAKLRSSLREFGFVNPIIIDKNYNVIAGHGRLLAAKEEGMKEIPCVYVDYLTEAQKKAYILADNRMALDAGWDDELRLVLTKKIVNLCNINSFFWLFIQNNYKTIDKKEILCYPILRKTKFSLYIIHLGLILCEVGFMKYKRLISIFSAIAIMCSGLSFPSTFNDYSINAEADFSLKDSYPNSANYIADCIIFGFINPNSGNYSTSFIKYSDVMDKAFSYEQLANNVMQDEGIVISSALWDTFSKILSGKISSGEVRQEQIYEAFLMDYLTFSEGSTENSTTLDKMGAFADKTMKYEDKILQQLLEKGIASDEKDLANLIEQSDSLNDKKIVEAMKELDWEKELAGYVEIADGITEVATNAADYFEALTKALALKEVNDERIVFLKSMAEVASDNKAFQTAVENIIETIESSYAELSLQEATDTMGAFAWDKCWDSIKKQIPCFSVYDNAHDALNYIFNSDSLSENNIRIIMQYTVGQYARQVLMAAHTTYQAEITDEHAAAFVEAYKNYLAYQGYSSEWAKEFVEDVPFSSDAVVDEWLTKLNSDINYCSNCIVIVNNTVKLYDKKIYDYDENDSSDDNNIESTFNGHSYQIFDSSMTWNEAKAYCENLGGHLVSITSQEEQAYITELLNSHDNTKNCYWIGLSGSKDNWQWVDNETDEYYNWAPNEPNNQDSRESYVHLFGNVWTGGKGIKEIGQWNDASNDGAGYSHDFYALDNFGFICEWDNTTNLTEPPMIFNEHSYQIFDVSMTWSEAEAYCEDLGGHLVSITTQEEQKAIEELLESGTRNNYWIGAMKDSNNGWNWVTGEDFKYQNWGNNQPDNFHDIENALMIYRNTNPKDIKASKFGAWNDLRDDGTCNGESFFGVENFGFICEWDNTTNSGEIESSEISGDCNNDGTFSVTDVVLLKKWILSVPNTTLANWKAADFYEDNQLNVFDLCLMKQKLIETTKIEKSGAIIIRTAEDLYNVRNNLSADYIIANDIDLTGYDWIPIGTLDHPFTGSIDGKGYTITGLSIDIQKSDSNYEAAGLFGVINGGNISQIKLENVSIYMDVNWDSKSFCYVGGIAGEIYSTKINKSSVTGNLEAKGTNKTFARVGGICASSVSNSEVFDCFVNAQLKADADSANTMAGGIVTWLDKSTINNCIAFGNILASNKHSYVYSGGINASGTGSSVNNCISMVNSIITSGSSRYVHPVSNFASINNCLSANDIEANFTSNNNVILIERNDAVKQEIYENLGWDLITTWILTKNGIYLR